MDGDAHDFLEGLQHCFSDLEDPRIAAAYKHLLLDILVITILAVICGADDWTDLETFGRLRMEWVQTFFTLPHGIPSHDTFRRVLGLLDPRQFAAGLFRWTRALHDATGGKLIAISIAGRVSKPPFSRSKVPLTPIVARGGCNEPGPFRKGNLGKCPPGSLLMAFPGTGNKGGDIDALFERCSPTCVGRPHCAKQSLGEEDRDVRMRS